MDEGFSCREGEGGTEAGNVPEMKESSFGNVVDVWQEREGRVKKDAKVTDVGGGGDNGAIDTEGEVLGSRGEGIWANDEDFGFIAVEL